MAHVVRVSLEGSDLGAVEAAAAELKVRLGVRFAITGRRLTATRNTLRISACMTANLDTVLDAEGVRQWVMPETWDTHVVEGRATKAAVDGEDERRTGGTDVGAPAALVSIPQP
ncbi:hypothetical protein [Belnapia sp. F-4-1]|uniref:hypothetical protein n=1 Tax=Belnapia sp. F-4-1 TaxID=1545443 RepID=UPI001186F0F0|nr:hypothetical protein [Belnapia sp. F-4-1]